MLHSKHDMLVDVQDMRCVLAVCFTHFCPGRRACLLPLDLDIMPRCGFDTNLGRTFSTCGWTSSFSTVYMSTISSVMCNVTASVKAVRRAPFLSYGAQWLNDSANVGWFIVGVYGLPCSCTSRSEKQVSQFDTCICLRGWNKWVGPLSLVGTAFKQTLQQSDATKPSY